MCCMTTPPWAMGLLAPVMHISILKHPKCCAQQDVDVPRLAAFASASRPSCCTAALPGPWARWLCCCTCCAAKAGCVSCWRGRAWAHWGRGDTAPTRRNQRGGRAVRPPLGAGASAGACTSARSAGVRACFAFVQNTIRSFVVMLLAFLPPESWRCWRTFTRTSRYLFFWFMVLLVLNCFADPLVGWLACMVLHL